MTTTLATVLTVCALGAAPAAHAIDLFTESDFDAGAALSSYRDRAPGLMRPTWRMAASPWGVARSRFFVSPYVGIGSRSLFDANRGAFGARLPREGGYATLGVLHRFMPTEHTRLSSSIQYSWLMRGAQTVRLSDTGWLDGTSPARHGHGLRLATEYELERWSFGGFLGFWRSGDSDAPSAGAPSLWGQDTDSRSTEFGLSARYRF